MWKVNDMVSHGADGVCRIVAIEKMDLIGNGRKEYYILEPVYTSGTTIYVEVGAGDDSLSEPMSRESADALIDSIPELHLEWISDDKERQKGINLIIKSGNLKELLAAVSSLYTAGEERRSRGKKYKSADKQNLVRAEKAVNKMLAYSLQIDPDQVPTYIRKRLASA